MSDTTGWHSWLSGAGRIYRKRIGDVEFRIVDYGNGDVGLFVYGSDKLAARASLEECQILAHQTARLWAGDDE